jgi:hypothetical protein
MYYPLKHFHTNIKISYDRCEGIYFGFVKLQKSMKRTNKSVKSSVKNQTNESLCLSPIVIDRHLFLFIHLHV